MSSKLPRHIGSGRMAAVALVMMFAVQSPAQALLVWEPAPSKKMKGQHGSHHGKKAEAGKKEKPGKKRGRAKVFLLKGGKGEVKFMKPDLTRQPLELKRQKVKVRSTGMDNYHALIAESRPDAQTVESAVRYLYMRGKPSGNSPSLVNKAVKTRLEIVPAPLPREHRRYNANHDAVFVLRFKGAPVADTAITLTTANGSVIEGRTDRVGGVRFTFPDDLPEVKPGRRNNPPVEFVLSAQVQREDLLFTTTLSGQYHADPAHWQSFGLGVAVLGVGFVSGLAMNRRASRKLKDEKGGVE